MVVWDLLAYSANFRHAYMWSKHTFWMKIELLHEFLLLMELQAQVKLHHGYTLIYFKVM